jgi:hypothetical protein
MQEAIKKLLKISPCLKGKEIAKKLVYNKKQVNSFLYSNPDIFLRDDSFRWSLVPLPEIRIEFEENTWMDCNSFENSLLKSKTLLYENNNAIYFVVPENCRILLDAAARFLSLCNQFSNVGNTVTIDFSDCLTTLSYFNRIGFVDHLDKNVVILPHRPSESGAEKYRGNSDTVVEFGSLNPYEADKELVNQLTDRFVQQSDRKFEAAAFTVFSELIDNVSEHSETPIPGFAALQKYGGKRDHIQTVVSDSGLGLVATLAPSLQTHYPDIYKVLNSKNFDVQLVIDLLTKGGISRFGTGRGLGFKSSREQTIKFDAKLSVRQENFSVCIEYINGEIKEISKQTNLQTILGTHLCFDFFVD